MNEVVGILGGTFDPPHKAHLAIAKNALAHVDEVIMIPARIPPHKNRKDITLSKYRLDMTRLLAEADDRIFVSNIELNRQGPSYTIDTLRALNELNPFRKLRLIIGADMVAEFGLWKECEEILRLAPPLLFERPGSNLPDDLVADGPENISLEGRKILQGGRISSDVLDISSTQIRDALDKNMTDMLTPAVLEYIQKYELYG